MFANRIVYLAVYQIYVCTKKFPPLVRPVPQRGTVEISDEKLGPVFQ